MTEDEKQQTAESFIGWFAKYVEREATGANAGYLDTRPEGRFWLGRLAPEEEILSHDLGERAERLEPCAVGIRLLPSKSQSHASVSGKAYFKVWSKVDGTWRKSQKIEGKFATSVELDQPRKLRLDICRKEIAEAGIAEAISAAISIDTSRVRGGRIEASVCLVNTSDPTHSAASDHSRGRLFECGLEIDSGEFDDFVLETLPDSFRYDRRVPAWGINAGVNVTPDSYKTEDMPLAEKKRPVFWTVKQAPPDLRFETLASAPIQPLTELIRAHAHWGAEAWSLDTIKAQLGGQIDPEVEEEISAERAAFRDEANRLKAGVKALEEDELLYRSFLLMNEAMILSARGKYDSWRPFQVGFMLANLRSCRGEEQDLVDIVWFATGGGKTETYLGLILTAAFYDRLRGKVTGTTAWSRFPLRLLSLQQTQRFANALAAAELVRKRHGIKGEPFSLGFLVGDGSTPNKIEDGSHGHRVRWDANDLSMPDKLQMIKLCPFCREESISMRFRRLHWRLEHNCTNDDCPWGTDAPLPIHVVDTEIWRTLPTVIVGTLDKAAGISMQATMKGMIGAPTGVCTEEGHGHTYAPRYGKPTGCLVPDCQGTKGPLAMEAPLYGLTYRLQDELHLLRDSLGAVDAHYEALLDHLQSQLSSHTPKILASSATLAGYQRQSEVLYQRKARVFPHPEPRVGHGFWSADTPAVMRRFLAVAPRGQTIEYALDRMVVSLQSAIRRMLNEPEVIAAEIGVPPSSIPFLIDLYGTDVIYGNTLRDLDAVVRSASTQWGDIPNPKTTVESLTGRTQFGDVAKTLERLENPESQFEDRVHVVAASSMMSHGVDVDRLNIMVMMGLPLTTAEFIQATARVGRRWPSLAFIVHKIGRERDASVYRSFPKYVSHGDRFVEPIPITGRSKRVLERTIPGLAFGRILMLHEHLADKTIWKAYGLKDYVDGKSDFRLEEAKAICDFLGYDDDASASLRAEVDKWYETWLERVCDPANSNDWVNDLGVPALGPMRSLRDVAEAVEVWGRDPS